MYNLNKRLAVHKKKKKTCDANLCQHLPRRILEHSRTSKMEIFMKTINCNKTLTIYAKAPPLMSDRVPNTPLT